eukprot:403340402
MKPVAQFVLIMVGFVAGTAITRVAIASMFGNTRGQSRNQQSNSGSYDPNQRYQQNQQYQQQMAPQQPKSNLDIVGEGLLNIYSNPQQPQNSGYRNSPQGLPSDSPYQFQGQSNQISFQNQNQFQDYNKNQNNFKNL